MKLPRRLYLVTYPGSPLLAPENVFSSRAKAIRAASTLAECGNLQVQVFVCELVERRGPDGVIWRSPDMRASRAAAGGAR